MLGTAGSLYRKLSENQRSDNEESRLAATAGKRPAAGKDRHIDAQVEHWRGNKWDVTLIKGSSVHWLAFIFPK